MKKTKLSRITALLAAGALLFGGMFMSCSDCGDDGDVGKSDNNDNQTTSIVDYRIALTFDTEPTINTSSTGKVYLYKEAASSEASGPGRYGKLVDTISPNEGESAKDATYYTGASPTSGKIGKIAVKDNLLYVDGNDLILVPHTNENGYSLLEPNTTYFVAADSGVISGTLNGASLTSISDNTVWTFKTGSEPTISGSTINVKPDGTGEFYTIQGAFDYLRYHEKTGDWTINVAAGTYHERLFYYGSANITLVGEIASGTVGSDVKVNWKNADDWGDGGARSRAIFLVQGSGNMVIKNMTFTNTYDRTNDGDDGSTQAETISYDSTGKLVVYNSSFYSHQDTLYIGKKGNRSWFYKCYIEGDTDFIWGYADVALFEECSLRMVRDTAKSGQEDIIFASRADVDQPANKGFVLLNSSVTIDEGVTAYYGRNSGSDTNATVLNNTFFGEGTLSPKLYSSKPSKEIYDINDDLAIGYKDYNNTMNGTVVDTTSRLSGCDELTARVANREYSGRYVILNRGYSYSKEVYETASIWDISAYETEFSATADNSKSQIFIEPVATKKVVGGNSVTLKAYDINGNDVTSTVAWSQEETKDDEANYPDTIVASLETGVLATNKTTSGIVTVKATSGDFTDTAYVYVIPTYVSVNKVEFASDTITSSNLYALNTVTATLSAEDTTKEVSDTTVTWTTSDDSIIKFYNSTDNALVRTITTSSPTVQVYGAASGTATVTATSADGPAGTSSAIEVSSKVAQWDPYAGAIKVNTDVQSGVVGTYNAMIIDASTNNSKNSKSAKMGLKVGNTRIQTRNVILNIPVTADCDIVVKLETAPTTAATASTASGLNYQGLYADGTKVVWDEEALAYTIKFDYETQAVAGDKLEVKAISTKSGSPIGDDTGDFTSATSYAQLVFGSADVYILSITRTTDGQSYTYTDPVALDAEVAFSDTSDVILDLNGTTTSTRTATVSGTDAAKATAEYSSSDTSVATVDSATGEVSAKGIGYTTISAIIPADDQSTTFKSASYNVYVKDTTAVADSYKVKLTEIKTPQNAASYDFGIVSGTKCYWNDSSHGWAVNDGGTLSFAVNGASTVKIGGCQYGKATTLTLSNGTATVSGSYATDCSATTDLEWTGTAAEVLTLTVSGGTAYIPSVQVVSASAETDPKFNTIYSYELENVKAAIFASDDGVLSISATGTNLSTDHGMHLNTDSVIKVSVAGDSKISLLGCIYGVDSTITVASSSGTTLGTFTFAKAAAEKDASTYEYTGDADTLTLKVSEGGNTYLHGVTIAY